MATINILRRQHEDLCALLRETQSLVNTDNMDEHISEISRNINVLSGKLKFHIRNENDFLYPRLSAKGDHEVKHVIEKYRVEMNELSLSFSKFRVEYSTRVKIIMNKEAFLIESNCIFRELEKQMCKEDIDLYMVAEKYIR